MEEIGLILVIKPVIFQIWILTISTNYLVLSNLHKIFFCQENLLQETSCLLGYLGYEEQHQRVALYK